MWSVTKRHAPRSSGLGMPHLCIGLREIKLPTNSAFIVRCIVFFQTMAALDLYELGLDIWGGRLHSVVDLDRILVLVSVIVVLVLMVCGLAVGLEITS